VWKDAERDTIMPKETPFTLEVDCRRSEETHTCGNRLMYVKKDPCMWKETHASEKRPIHG